MAREEINGAPGDRIRRILKKLPRVKAAPGFETRLERRIGELERGDSGAGAPVRFSPRRIPAFGYSLVALVIVGVVSYYMFWRTGSVPVAIQEHVPPAISQPPAEVQNGEKGVNTISGAARREDLSRKKGLTEEAETRTKDVRVHGAAEKHDHASGSSGTSSAAQQTPRAALIPQSTLKAGEPLRGEQKIVSPNQEMQYGIRQNTPQPSQQVDANKVTNEGMVRSAAPPARQGKFFQKSAASFSAAAFRDSAAIRDSLLLDSLKRALQRLDSLQGKPGKKPR